MDISDIASLDFETGSHVDLRKTGAARYAEDSTTRMICLAGYVPKVGGVRTTYATGQMEALKEWVSAGGMLSAWNAVFEYYIWNTVLPRQFPNQTFPKLRIEQLVDTMVVAAYWGLPLKLDTAAQALPHLGVQKDAEGHRLMMQMNKPRDRKADTWWHETDPAKLRRLMDYCRQDVRVERSILADLPSPSGFLWGLLEHEREVWEMDTHLFTRGVVLDKPLVDQMQHVAGHEILRLHAEMNRITHGTVPKTTNASKLIDWFNIMQGENIKSLAKDKLADILERDDLLPDVRDALEIRQEAAKSSVAKLNAMEACVCADGRMKGLTQYYGAFRSGRDAGRLIQVQNYPRSAVKDQSGLVDYILSGGDPDGFDLFFGVTPMTGLSSALRGCITVPTGRKLGAIDFSQIEARVTPWLAGAEWKLDLFRAGKDLYKVAANKMFGTPVDQVDGDERQLGKVSELALAFGGGVGAFQSMAANYGVKIPDEQADDIKVAWRDANPEIVKFWYELEGAAKSAIKMPGHSFRAGEHIDMIVWQGMLLMRLPSGRAITYREPELHHPEDPEDAWKGEQITYMDLDQYTRQWERVHTYGGALCNNATQGTARDVLKAANLRCYNGGHILLTSIHDETLFELFGRELEFAKIEEEFSRVPKWAKGLPISADGYVGDRFKKG